MCACLILLESSIPWTWTRSPSQHSSPPCTRCLVSAGKEESASYSHTKKYLPLFFLVAEVLDNLTESDPSTRARPREQEHNQYTVKNAVYRNTPGEQYFTVSMVTHIVTTETVKYCSPGVFSYTAFFTVYVSLLRCSYLCPL